MRSSPLRVCLACSPTNWWGASSEQSLRLGFKHFTGRGTRWDPQPGERVLFGALYVVDQRFGVASQEVL